MISPSDYHFYDTDLIEVGTEATLDASSSWGQTKMMTLLSIVFILPVQLLFPVMVSPQM